MKKIFLVEDEYIVREGIKNKIDWEGLGLEFSGEASDGEVALEMITKIKPDIVMTDIKMPFMDGLTLSRHIKESLPETEIILLTGFADFEFAREGMKIGVSQYLTKPVKPEEITEALTSVVKKITEKEEKETKVRNQMLEREERLKVYYATQNMPTAETVLDMNEIDIKQLDRARHLEFLKLGDKNEAKAFVDEIFGSIEESATKSLIFRQYIVMDAYFTVTDFVESIGGERNVIEQPDSAILSKNDIAPTVEYIYKITKTALELRDNKAFNKYEDIVSKTKAFVAIHYSDADMSLNTAAESVGFSPNHLSSVFSQQTGQTFIKYLTDYRLEKAKELLKCTAMRTHEIAASVGYEDSHYFSFIFKKNVGITPSQFRGE